MLSVRNIIKVIIKKYLYIGTDYDIRSKYTLQECNDIIRQLLADNKPHFIGRFGNVEANALLGQIRQERSFLLYKYSNSDKQCLSINAGMFSNTFFGRHIYLKKMKKAIKKMDWLELWKPPLYSEKVLVHKYGSKNLNFIDFTANFPFRFNNPWSDALRGKKVLVINQNDKLIQEQYKIKDILFPEHPLPDFELKTYKPFFTSGTNGKKYKSWNYCLKRMINDISKIDFDIALVSCGSYGIPLCHSIFKRGKKVIYIGGILQLIFGIKGKRWDVKPEFNRFYNIHFKYPLEDSKPDDFELIEDGCYWG